jgi:hypothetical protein
MAGLGPAIHVLLLDNCKDKDVDARYKAGHDACGSTGGPLTRALRVRPLP